MYLGMRHLASRSVPAGPIIIFYNEPRRPRRVNVYLSYVCRHRARIMLVLLLQGHVVGVGEKKKEWLGAR